MNSEFAARRAVRGPAVGWISIALFAWLALAGWQGPALAGPVNVNSADAATLARELHGIGPAKAQAIVAHRDKHGPFRTLDDLARVRGIGRKTLDRNRELVRFDGRATPAAERAAAVGPAPVTRGATAPARAPAAPPPRRD